MSGVTVRVAGGGWKCLVSMFVSTAVPPEQVHELHTKHSAEAVKAEKWQFEYNNLHDKYDSLCKEKEVRHIHIC